MPIKPNHHPFYTLRIANGNRAISVLMESQDEPDMLGLFREFCLQENVLMSDRLHREFAEWLVRDKGCEFVRIKEFGVYSPDFVRSQIK